MYPKLQHSTILNQLLKNEIANSWQAFYGKIQIVPWGVSEQKGG